MECLLTMVDEHDLPDIIHGGKAKCSHPDGWAFVDEGPWNDNEPVDSGDVDMDQEGGDVQADVCDKGFYDRPMPPFGKKWRRPEWIMMNEDNTNKDTVG